MILNRSGPLELIVEHFSPDPLYFESLEVFFDSLGAEFAQTLCTSLVSPIVSVIVEQLGQTPSDERNQVALTEHEEAVPDHPRSLDGK